MFMGEAVKQGLLEVGTRFVFEDGSSILIGDATPYNQDTTSSEIGWSCNDSRRIKEIHFPPKDPNVIDGRFEKTSYSNPQANKLKHFTHGDVHGL